MNNERRLYKLDSFAVDSPFIDEAASDILIIWHLSQQSEFVIRSKDFTSFIVKQC